MYFRNALRLLVDNFKNVYKIALYKIIVTLVALAFCSAMIVPSLMELWNDSVTQALVGQTQAFFTALFSADNAALSALKDGIFGENGSLAALGELLSSKMGSIVLVLIGCILVYLIKRFVETLYYFAIGDVLDDKMATYGETTVMPTFVAKLGKACRYALVYVPVTFLFDAFTVFLAVLLLSVMNVTPALFLGVTAIVLIQALKLTFTGLWLPAMTTDNKSLKTALQCDGKEEAKKRWKIFPTYIALVYVVIIVNVVAAICTFGSALLLTVPASYMIFICQQYVYYYTIKGKRYFLTYESIEKNTDRGDRAHFFDYIDENDQTEQH